MKIIIGVIIGFVTSDLLRVIVSSITDLLYTKAYKKQLEAELQEYVETQ